MRTLDELRDELAAMADEVQHVRPLPQPRVRRIWTRRAVGVALLGATAMAVVMAATALPSLRRAAPRPEGPRSQATGPIASGTVSGKTWTLTADSAGVNLLMDVEVNGVSTGLTSPLDAGTDVYYSVSRMAGAEERLLVFGYVPDPEAEVEIVARDESRRGLELWASRDSDLSGRFFLTFEPLTDAVALVVRRGGDETSHAIDYRAVDPPTTPAGELAASGDLVGQYWEVRSYAKYDYACAVLSLARRGMGEGAEVCGYPEGTSIEEYYVPSVDGVVLFGTVTADVASATVVYSDGETVVLEIAATATRGQRIVSGSSTRARAAGEILARSSEGEVLFRAPLDTPECIRSLPGFSGTCS